jgi:hypothetical protein
MECSICFEEITKQTGCTTLSCDHSFHFRCITNWFGSQICNDLDQTCPCCRNKGVEMDRCSIVEGDEEEEDEEDETYVDDEEDEEQDEDLPEDFGDLLWERVGPGSWIITTRQEVAYEGLRALFGALNQPEFVEDPMVEAARKIQAIYRGFKARETFHVARSLHRLRG